MNNKFLLMFIFVFFLFSCERHVEYHGLARIDKNNYYAVQDLWDKDSEGWKRFCSVGISTFDDNGNFKRWELCNDLEVLRPGKYRISKWDLGLEPNKNDYIYFEFSKKTNDKVRMYEK